MQGACRDCRKCGTCFKPSGFKFGYCNSDFEPKEKQIKNDKPYKMKWEQVSSSEWQAIGEDGAFYIERSRGLFWGRYSSAKNGKCFKMKPTKKLSEAKAFCEENFYWESTGEKV